MLTALDLPSLLVTVMTFSRSVFHSAICSTIFLIKTLGSFSIKRILSSNLRSSNTTSFEFILILVIYLEVSPIKALSITVWSSCDDFISSGFLLSLKFYFRRLAFRRVFQLKKLSRLKGKLCGNHIIREHLKRRIVAVNLVIVILPVSNQELGRSVSSNLTQS